MTVEEFCRLPPEGGSLRLLDGYLVERDPMDPPHAYVAEALRSQLAPFIPTRFSLRKEKPVVIPDFDLPRPDFSVVRGTFREYATRHPTPEDILLLIEVSDSTLAEGLLQKTPHLRPGSYYSLLDRQSRAPPGGNLFAPPPPGLWKPKIYRSPKSFPVILEKESLGQIPVDTLFPRE